MPLFEYRIQTDGGKFYASKITAKSEAAAREQIAKKFKVVDWIGIKVVAPLKPKAETQLSAQSAKKPAARSVKPSPVQTPKQSSLSPKPALSGKKETKLDKLLFRQNGKCFFCARVLDKSQASIEHLLPKSAGGTNADGNVVACCLKLNHTLADMSLKEKIGFILGKAHPFQCPT